MPSDNERLDIGQLETWLWDAACAIRGATDALKFKDFILPLVFYKRLSDVFDDEFKGYIVEYGDEETARAVIEADHKDALKAGRRGIVRFYVPKRFTWKRLRNHPGKSEGDVDADTPEEEEELRKQSLGEFVTTAMRKVALLNPALDGVLNVKDYNEKQSGQRTLDDDRLAALIEVMTRHRLGLKNTEPDILGRAYEYLLRKFAEGQGQSAGEFFTPKEVGWLMAELIDPAPKTTVYDPCLGSGGLLIKARLLFETRHPERRNLAPRLVGQELNPTTYAMAKMNMFLHDYTDARLTLGDTLRDPQLASEGAGTERFNYVVANPPWNLSGYDERLYLHDKFNRFGYGAAPSSSADWGWVQHMLASLSDQGRAAIVLDTGAVSRGSGSKSSNKERDIRKALVEADLIEGVVLLPENLFYNTSAPAILLLLNRQKPAERRGQCLLINASQHFVKEKPKNVLTDAGIAAVAEAYRAWETREKLSRVVTLDEVRAADYNLSPSQFVEVADRVEHRPLADILADLAMARAERERADTELATVLAKLGLDAGVR